MIEGYDPNAPREESPPPYSGTPPPLDEERNGPAWEWREKLGFSRALLITIREVLFEPSGTFRLAAREGGLGSPLAYFLIMQIGMGVIAYFIALPFMLSNRNLFGEFFQAEQVPEAFRRFSFIFATPAGIFSGLLTQFTLVPLAKTISIFIAAGLIHLLLLVFGGARFPFEATFRAAAYSSGACAVLLLVPLCGWLLQSIVWGFILIIGLAKIHETDTWRVALAVMLPGLLLLTFLAALLFAVVFSIMGAAG